MSQWKKRYDKIKNNPAGTTIDELKALCEHLGFIRSPGKGDHIHYEHLDYPGYVIGLDNGTKRVKVYACKVIEVIEENEIEIR